VAKPVVIREATLKLSPHIDLIKRLQDIAGVAYPQFDIAKIRDKMREEVVNERSRNWNQD